MNTVHEQCSRTVVQTVTEIVQWVQKLVGCIGAHLGQPARTGVPRACARTCSGAVSWPTAGRVVA